jgi:putative tricarboxylic transport membrane protein
MNSPTPSWKPQREIELIAGTPPGGGQDRPARTLIKIFADERLVEFPVKLINVVGKGGGKAWDYLLERPGDPHVLAISSPPLLTNRFFGVSDYDHAALTPIANLYSEYVAFVARADSSIADMPELQRRLGANAGSVTVSLATALGTTNHIALAQVAMQAGGDVRALSIRVFDSARFAVADVLAGNAEVAAVSAVSAAPEITDGQLRPLAVTAPKRLGGIFAQAPTLLELAVDCDGGTWRGVLGAPQLSEAQRVFWEQTLQAATRTEQWNAELDRQFWMSGFLNGAQCAAFLDRERDKLRAAMAALGLVH